MLKHSFWPAVLGLLLAAGLLVYLQTRRSTPIPIAPPAHQPTTSGTARPPATWNSLPPPAPRPAVPAVTEKICPPPTMPGEPTAPNTYDFPQADPVFDPAIPSVFSADRSDPNASFSPGTMALWTSGTFSEAVHAGNSQISSLFNKRPAEDEPVKLDFNPANFGPQYLLIRKEDTTLLGRAAGRFAQVYPGLSDEQRVAELLLGCQVEHRLGRRNKLSSAVEYVRNPADLTSHSIRTQAAWEVLLDPEENLSLRTAVLESSSYAPNREQAKSLNYSLNLMWKF